MNKPITFEEMACLNAWRYRYQMLQYQDRHQTPFTGSVPIWQHPSQYRLDTGMLTTYFHIIIRHHINQHDELSEIAACPYA